MRSFLVAAFVLLAGAAAGAPSQPAAAETIPVAPLVPQPESAQPQECAAPLSLERPMRFDERVDPGGFELLRERWTALGIPVPVRGGAPLNGAPAINAFPTAVAGTTVERHAYLLRTTTDTIFINSADPESAFDALTTLAQLPQRRGGRWIIPCVTIYDKPAMPWRIVSDDVSRGPFPTVEYAHARIRTLASLKINGWSPYMEQVVADPRYPFVAWPNGWTPAQLHELAQYARRFHVTLIPEQQTFAHMHESLKWEQIAPLGELPHGYLLAESDPRTYAYLEPLVKSVVAATQPVPFVHLGADEPLDLGRGRTPRSAQVVADHVTRVTSFLAGSGARPVIWDDAIQQDPSILKLIPPSTVVATFHYGVEKTYKPYVDTIANAGFDQLIAPGAANWNEIYPDLTTAYTNVARFTADAKGAPHLLGMFMTVWHDDGETLYEAAWPSVAYAAATAWQAKPVDDATWHRTFARVFFGSDDPRYAADLDALQAIRPLIRTTPSDPPDYLFWRDPFDPRVQSRAQSMDLAGVRTRAETVLQHLWTARPPLHPQAADVMRLGALRYDALARRLQIGKEAHDYYDDARAHATKPEVSQVYRSLGVAKYLCWELRDEIANIEPVYVSAWRYESTEGGLAHMLAHYRVAQDDAQRCGDRIDGVMREDYLRHATVPPWDEVMPAAHSGVMRSTR
ncbi:MAG TPA: glycoside hydrolase family 20 zincin-like fold domain-containing protein [Candidatus Elarobacter sp.]|nr:glycoside hydrolase family 20 zincin-like fold domain-containing protein [Candidatus Elarobacter sp.]